MSSDRAVLFANGEYHSEQARRAKVSNKDFLICVDGGLKHCLSEGLQPAVLLGDFDSLDVASEEQIEKLDIERIQYPAEKDASDLELAFQLLEERSIKSVVVLGASGARSDHHLFNWQLFASRQWPFQLRIVDDFVDAHVVHSSNAFDQGADDGQVFSVIPCSSVATDVNVVGAKYPLSKATIKPGDTVGLSNQVNGSHLQVNTGSGILLVMLVHKDR